MFLQFASKRRLERLIAAEAEASLDSVKSLLACGLPMYQVNFCLLISKFDNMIAYSFSSMAFFLTSTTNAES
jgi:hypothetical protein